MVNEAWDEVVPSIIINAFGVLFGGRESIFSNLPDRPNHFDESDSLPLITLRDNEHLHVRNNMDLDADIDGKF